MRAADTVTLTLLPWQARVHPHRTAREGRAGGAKEGRGLAQGVRCRPGRSFLCPWPWPSPEKCPSPFFLPRAPCAGRGLPARGLGRRARECRQSPPPQAAARPPGPAPGRPPPPAPGRPRAAWQFRCRGGRRRSGAGPARPPGEPEPPARRARTDRRRSACGASPTPRACIACPRTTCAWRSCTRTPSPSASAAVAEAKARGRAAAGRSRATAVALGQR